MGRSSVSGPITGHYLHVGTYRSLLTASQTDFPLFIFTAPAAGRIEELIVRCGGQAITAHKFRKLGSDAVAPVAVGSTQVLSADGGAIAADNRNRISPTGSTPTLLAAQRDFVKGDQYGVFVSNAAVTPNIQVELTVFINGHVQPIEAND